MIQRIFSTVVVLILLNGCVGTMKIAEEDSIKNQSRSPMQAKPSEDNNSSHK